MQNNYSMNGGLADWFSQTAKEISPAIRDVLKEAAQKILKGNEGKRAAQQEAAIAQEKAEQVKIRNRNIVIAGGVGLAALTVVVLMTRH